MLEPKDVILDLKKKRLISYTNKMGILSKLYIKDIKKEDEAQKIKSPKNNDESNKLKKGM